MTSVNLIAQSVGTTASDRESMDALASIGQITSSCLSLPALLHTSMQTVAKLVGTINRLSYSSDGSKDSILQAVHVLCIAIFDLLEK